MSCSPSTARKRSCSRVAEQLPLLSQAIVHVAHPAIRTRGTFGGSGLADPAAELPACSIALDAELIAASATGMRRIPASEFFRDLFDSG